MCLAAVGDSRLLRLRVPSRRHRPCNQKWRYGLLGQDCGNGRGYQRSAGACQPSAAGNRLGCRASEAPLDRTLTRRHLRAAPSERRVSPTRPSSLLPRLAHLVESPERTVTITLAALGIGLRAWQYLANNSLFLDEAALARNIIDRPVTGLFRGPRLRAVSASWVSCSSRKA